MPQELRSLDNFWTHGVATIVEYPQRPLRRQSAGWGTLVEQGSETFNWFHLPLYCSSVLVGSDRPGGTQRYNALFGGARLKATLNENAEITDLHLRAGEQLIYSQAANIRGPNVDYDIDARSPAGGGYRLIDVDDAGLTLCVRVRFLTGEPIGQVIFRGAGAYYGHV